MTLAGGIAAGLASGATFALSSVVELEPSLDRTGPSRSFPFGFCLESSLPNSS